ncbi:MAG: PQQ-binding-like beta-propeller repeat protein, partial [Ktedonobacterales bacterium]
MPEAVGRPPGARRVRGTYAVISGLALTLALALSGCAGGSTARVQPHATLANALASQSVYVTILLDQTYQNPGVTLALNAQTGALRWNANTTGPGAAPAVAGGAVFVAPEDGSIRSLDAATGAPRWTYTRATGVSAQYGFDGYAVISGATLFVTSDSGAVFALDPATGKLRWMRTWPHTSDTIYAAPAVDGGMVFVPVGGQDGGAYALDAATGAIRWHTAHLEGFDARPVVADGVVYFSGQTPGTLVALDEKTGATRWEQGSSGTSSAPVVSGGLVYTAGADEIIRAYHVTDGSTVWTFQTGGSAGNALIATGAALTFDGGTLYA